MDYGAGTSHIPRPPPPPEKAPFSEACQAPDSIKGRPATGLFVRKYPSQDTEGHKTADFLGNVLDLAVQKLDRDLTFVENLKSCYAENRSKTECHEMRAFAEQQVPQLIKDVRFHLSVAQSPKDLISGFGQTNTTPNYRMRAWGTVKLKSWQLLDKDEYAVAKAALTAYQSEIIAHYLKAWNQEKYTATYGGREVIKASLIQVRFQHFQQYRSFMAAAPFLQYFTKADPTVQEVITAFEEFQANAKVEKEMLAGYQIKLQGEATASETDVIVGTVMQYSAYIEFALMESPELCGLATSLMYTSSNRALGTAVSMGLPLLAASFFAPGLIAYPLGVLASAYFAMDAYHNYQTQKIRSGSVLFFAPGGTTDPLTEADDQFTTELVLFPLSLVGGRLVGTAIRSRLAGSAVIADARLNFHTYLPKSLLTVIEKFSRRRI